MGRGNRKGREIGVDHDKVLCEQTACQCCLNNFAQFIFESLVTEDRGDIQMC